MVAICSQQHSILFFTSGVLFIISGLFMLIGLIMYISIFKAEIGSKLRPRSTLQPALFTFEYGHSFLLYVFGFICTEFVGILNVFLYIKLQQNCKNKSVPCFSYYSKETDTSFSCKKHPTGFYLSPNGEKRYFFDKPTKCDLHSESFTKSLNELYTEPAPILSPFDYPTKVAQPLTRSVSTATDIYSDDGIKSPKMKKSFSKENLENFCGILTKNEDKSKEKLFGEFCKKAGPRCKPKNIYYIEDNTKEQENNVYIVDAYNNRDSFYRPASTNIRRSRNFDSNKSLNDFNRNYPKTTIDMSGSCDRHLWDNHLDDYLTGSNRNLYQSRTLPRNFHKKSVNFLDQNSMGERRVSANGLYIPSRDDQHFQRKSYDELNLNYHQNHDFQSDKNLAVKWPSVIARSPSNYSIRSQHGFDDNFQSIHNEINQDIESNSDECDTFDLDKIEKERRQSHASLFDMRSFDYTRSTAV